MHRGPAGAGNLNTAAAAGAHPGPRRTCPERRYGGRVFRVGDKVTQIRNNYDKGAAGVFNGTVGVVTALSTRTTSTLTVRTDEDEDIDYDFDELDELAHAYAVTIHRSQGSEYPAVVIPLTTSAWMMLQRNLLYTAVTRAKSLVVLAGCRALAMPSAPPAPAAATPPSPTASTPPPPPAPDRRPGPAPLAAPVRPGAGGRRAPTGTASAARDSAAAGQGAAPATPPSRSLHGRGGDGHRLCARA